jgi:hypothetical protein
MACLVISGLQAPNILINIWHIVRWVSGDNLRMGLDVNGYVL